MMRKVPCVVIHFECQGFVEPQEQVSASFAHVDEHLQLEANHHQDQEQPQVVLPDLGDGLKSGQDVGQVEQAPKLDN